MRWASTPSAALQALQRTPNGAAELGRRACCRQLDVTRLAEQPARRWTRCGVPLPIKVSALRARTSRQAPAGIEPAASWQALRGKWLAPLHITGCCTHARQSFAGSLPPGMRATPVMSGAHSAPAAWPAGYSSPRSKTVSMCGQGFALAAGIEVRRFALSVESTPAHPASQPRRGRAADASLLARRVCQASRPPPPGGGSLNSRTRLPMRCKPPESPCTARDSVLRPERVKAKPCGRAARGLDPATT